MSTWCNNYINRVDKSVKVVTEDLLRWHAVFYSMCQALFYIISFKHQELMDSKRSKLLPHKLQDVPKKFICFYGKHLVNLIFAPW